MQLLRVLIKENLLKEQDSAPAGAEPTVSLNTQRAVERDRIWAIKDSKFLVPDLLLPGKKEIELKAGTEVSPKYKEVYTLKGVLLAKRNDSDSAWLVTFPDDKTKTPDLSLQLMQAQKYSYEADGSPDVIVLGMLPGGSILAVKYSTSTKDPMSLGIGRHLSPDEIDAIQRESSSLEKLGNPFVNEMIKDLAAYPSNFEQDADYAYRQFGVFAIDDEEKLKRPAHGATEIGKEEADLGGCVITTFDQLKSDISNASDVNARRRIAACFKEMTVDSNLFIAATIIAFILVPEGYAVGLAVAPFIVLALHHAVNSEWEEAGSYAVLIALQVALSGLGGATKGAGAVKGVGVPTRSAIEKAGVKVSTSQATLRTTSASRGAASRAFARSALRLSAQNPTAIMPKSKILRIITELSLFGTALNYMKEKNAESRDRIIRDEAKKLVDDIYGDRTEMTAAELETALQVYIDAGAVDGAAQGLNKLFPAY